MSLSATSITAKSVGNLSLTAGYYGAFLALGLVQASLGPALPTLAENTQSRLSDISYLFMARAVGYLAGSLLGGRLFDRLPGHPVLTLALIMMSVMMFFIPVVPLLWLLVGLMLLLGTAESVLDVGGNTLLVWLHGQKVGPFMNGLHFFFGVGAFLSPIIIVQAKNAGGSITWAFWLLGLLVLPGAFWLSRLTSPTDPARPDTVEPPQFLDMPQAKAATPAPVGNAPRWGLTALLVAFFFIYVGAEVGFGGWIFSFVVVQELTGEAAAGYLTSAFWGAFTMGRLLAVPVSVRLLPRTMLLVSLVGALGSIGLILLSPQALAVIWVGTIGLGFWLASIFPSAISLAGRHMKVTGRVTGLFLAGASVGAMVLPWLIGQLFEWVGPQAMLLVILIDLLVALVIFATIFWLTRRREPTQSMV